jgi:hypothetical protein
MLLLSIKCCYICIIINDLYNLLKMTTTIILFNNLQNVRIRVASTSNFNNLRHAHRHHHIH